MRRRTACGSLLPTLLALVGCVDADGGAAELSWSLFERDGDSIDCDDGRIDRIRLCWAAEGGSTTTCAPETRASFACGDRHGATSFDLELGPTSFWVEPICRDGEVGAPGTFQVPAPIVRDVRAGKVVNLTALAIVVTESDGDTPTCAP
jgi:hypothetical protein